METIRQEFLAEAIKQLEILSARLHAEPFSAELETELFRRLHTLKGTAQTLNFNVSGKLAHEIENLLQAARDQQIPADENFTSLLNTGINLLLETFRTAEQQKEVVFPVDYVALLHDALPDFAELKSDNLSGIVSPELLKQLSAQEKENLSAAIGRGNFLYIIEAGFDFANFGEQFKNLREKLSEQGEIIANFPSPKFNLQNKIGFQIFFVSLKASDSIKKIIKPFGAELVSQNQDKSLANDVRGVIKQAVSAGEIAARKLLKEIEFETVYDETKIPVETLKPIAEILLHLVRNAVDHAIEATGKIKIEIEAQESSVVLRLADDGRGINLEKVRTRALAKNLVSAAENLTDEDLRNLIFASGFSTSEQVSEISGRGVGLDVVADTVKKMRGQIRVESESGKGTIFEIILPTNNPKSKI